MLTAQLWEMLQTLNAFYEHSTCVLVGYSDYIKKKKEGYVVLQYILVLKDHVFKCFTACYYFSV